MPDVDLVELGNQLRVDTVRAAAAAGSGHPTSGLSAADLMAVLIANHLRYDFDRPGDPNNEIVAKTVKGEGVETVADEEGYHGKALSQTDEAVAEQQMIANAVGLQARGWLPFVSTFAAFLTRAHDFIRMAAVLKLDGGEMPSSGKPDELLGAAGIDAAAIADATRSLITTRRAE